MAVSILVWSFLTLGGCGDDVVAPQGLPTTQPAAAAEPDPRTSSVTARVDGDSPLEITSGALTATTEPPGAWATHVVTIRNSSDRTVGIDDIRFSGVPVPRQAGTSSNLITAGYLCGVTHADAEDRPAPGCRLGERSIILRPGETHGDVVTVYARLPGASAEAGSYILDQPVKFWFDPGSSFTKSTPSGTATIRLEYELKAANRVGNSASG